MRYLIYCTAPTGKLIGAIIDVPREWSSDDYGQAQRAFVATHGRRPKCSLDAFASMIALHDFDRTTNGVYYDWGLAGANGASFTLIGLPDQSRDQLQTAANEIRRTRDVVHLNTIRIATLVEWTFSFDLQSQQG